MKFKRPKGKRMNELVISDSIFIIAPKEPTPTLAIYNYLGRLRSMASRKTMWNALASMSAIYGVNDPTQFAWHSIRQEDITFIRNKLLEVYKPSTINNRLSALRGVLEESWRIGLIDENDYRRLLVADVKNRRDPASAGRWIESSELHRIFETLNRVQKNRNKSVRDAALIAVLVGSGMRSAELRGLTMDMVNEDATEFKFKGKGEVERWCAMVPGMQYHFDKWLEVRTRTSGAVFCRIDRHGNLHPQAHITTSAIRDIIYKTCDLAGIKRLSPHDFRRKLASEMWSVADGSMIQRQLGHAQITTSQMYDRRPKQEQKKAVEKVRF